LVRFVFAETAGEGLGDAYLSNPEKSWYPDKLCFISVRNLLFSRQFYVLIGGLSPPLTRCGKRQEDLNV
jgi:hypothetical protein